MNWKDVLRSEAAKGDTIAFLNEVREFIHTELSPVPQPVDFVRWVPVDMVTPNDYNPNAVASIEMGLLYKSIKHDGYTQPIVTVWDEQKGKYVIVDGFHRYFVGKTQKDINELNKGHLPIVVIKKTISERMAATVRHNRARGSHSVQGMSHLVFEMFNAGMQDHEICNELGMEATELVKLKHITGFSYLFKDEQYRKAWEAKSQIELRKKYKEIHGGATPRNK